MNFAPYQDDSPEHNRAQSPAPVKPQTKRAASSYTPQSQHRVQQPPAAPSVEDAYDDDLPSPEAFENNNNNNNSPANGIGVGRRGAGFGNGLGADERNVDVFSTSLPMRVDYEACMAYLLLPPAGGALLLMLEHKSDYVRFHAWQSSLLFTFLFLVHLIFSFSRFVSFTLLVVDLGLIGYLTLHAYRDADTLERCQIPYFGRLASNFVDEE